MAAASISRMECQGRLLTAVSIIGLVATSITGRRSRRVSKPRSRMKKGLVAWVSKTKTQWLPSGAERRL